MKKAILVGLFALAGAGLAMGQNWSSPVDVLGAHNKTAAAARAATSRTAARSVRARRNSVGFWQLCIVGTGCQPAVRQDDCLWRRWQVYGSFAVHNRGGSQEVGGILLCLSCHDGNVTPTNMMANQSYEQRIGLLTNRLWPATNPNIAGQRRNHSRELHQRSPGGTTRHDQRHVQRMASYSAAAKFTVTAGYPLRTVRSQLRLASIGPRKVEQPLRR